MVTRLTSFALGLALLLLCALAAFVGLSWMFVSVLFNSARAWRLAVSFDQLANTAFGGDEDETISSRAGKEAQKGRWWACRLCQWLDRFDPGHCQNNLELDEGRRPGE